MKYETNMKYYTEVEVLKMASDYAKEHTGCTKVSVGSLIWKNNRILSRGVNRAIPNLCKGSEGCLRVELHGSNSKEFRGAADCRAIHSEIDAICKSKTSLKGSTIFVTRYPCEGCARAIVAAGISKVVYGREQVITEMTKEILDWGNVEVTHASEFKEDDTVL